MCDYNEDGVEIDVLDEWFAMNIILGTTEGIIWIQSSMHSSKGWSVIAQFD